ncbi:MAG TPA: hypothetical protein DEB39_00795 [Planctomycetaceae bacterium]|nr:hypothetical protein [Planctomycetaceae bacterium]
MERVQKYFRHGLLSKEVNVCLETGNRTIHDTVNGLIIRPRTIARRSNDPFMSLYKQELEVSAAGRRDQNVRFLRVSSRISP